ncbi:uncharacterized protein LOC132268891 isoform X4 [Cornus florida]|uniref:uncharacterized protein LOC132268891 isoform X4 n=1 Tax=Cornus florida TaxID=4283 RepID=UPI00289F35E6|nr:uncharacterized protein LOC132268891 isoform X4 [Cornus florida]
MRSLLFSYSHSFSLWESSYCAPRNRKFIMMSNTTKFLLPMISNNLILTPPPLAISAATSSNYYHNKTSSPHHPGPVVPSTLQLNDKPLLMKRREAIFNIIGLGIVLVDVLLHPQPVAAAEATVSSSCELTVAPSGLAFCDKVVGSGPEAVKGQLIKAHYIGKLENGKVFDSSYNRGKPLIFRVGVGEDLKTKKTIGGGFEKDGLYYFQPTTVSTTLHPPLLQLTALDIPLQIVFEPWSLL